VLNGLYLLYTSQNLLGTIFRVTFTVFYRRIWNIVGKYSILCCDSMYTVYLVCLWSIAHLKTCCWYIDYGKAFCPVEEEDAKKACDQADP
jgi:hypothetical protein